MTLADGQDLAHHADRAGVDPVVEHDHIGAMDHEPLRQFQGGRRFRDHVVPLVLQHEAEQTFACGLPFTNHDPDPLFTHRRSTSLVGGVIRGERRKS